MLAKQLNHFIRLSRIARSNIIWLYTYNREWNGVSKISVGNKTDPRFSGTIDVSGSWCCGTFFNTQSLSFPWCINKEYVCFSQTLVYYQFSVQSSQCTYSIKTAFVNLQCPSSGGSVPYYQTKDIYQIKQQLMHCHETMCNQCRCGVITR